MLGIELHETCIKFVPLWISKTKQALSKKLTVTLNAKCRDKYQPCQSCSFLSGYLRHKNMSLIVHMFLTQTMQNALDTIKTWGASFTPTHTVMWCGICIYDIALAVHSVCIEPVHYMCRSIPLLTHRIALHYVQCPLHSLQSKQIILFTVCKFKLPTLCQTHCARHTVPLCQCARVPGTLAKQPNQRSCELLPSCFGYYTVTVGQFSFEI